MIVLHTNAQLTGARNNLFNILITGKKFPALYY